MIKCHNSCQYLQMIAKLVEVIFLQKHYTIFMIKDINFKILIKKNYLI